ncbi:MAG TPA: ABC transporter permease [Solirubrobacteraceae bacterium]|nr:ABC transporter permease [Solirubrobacteraceae bacterium]
MTTKVTLTNVLRSEWTKLWSLRSTRWSLLVACLAMAGLGPLIAALTMSRWNHMSLAQRLTIDPIDRGLGGWHIAQLAIGVLGVLVISGEYASGQIRSSLLAVPRRLPVLWAKLIVFSGVTFVLMLITAVISFYGSQAIFAEHHINQSLGSPHALRTLIGTVLFMTATGVFCAALGTILRATAGGISTFVGVLFVLPPFTEILPTGTYQAIHPYLPSNAGMAIAQAIPDSFTLSPWGGFALFCGYTAALVALAAYLLRRRDA